jgi:hypothetical protein
MPEQAGGRTDADAKARRNERLKLLATTVNTIGLAFLVSGVIVPIISLLYGADQPRSPIAAWIGAWWIAQAIMLHLGARSVLGGIEG